MTPFKIHPMRFALVLFTTSGLMLAQDQAPAPQPQPQPAPGGWRRVGDPPPAPQAQPPGPQAQAQDPSEPVDRTDQYGQPAQAPAAQAPAAHAQAQPDPAAPVHPPTPPHPVARHAQSTPAPGQPAAVPVVPGEPADDPARQAPATRPLRNRAEIQPALPLRPARTGAPRNSTKTRNAKPTSARAAGPRARPDSTFT